MEKHHELLKAWEGNWACWGFVRSCLFHRSCFFLLNLADLFIFFSPISVPALRVKIIIHFQLSICVCCLTICPLFYNLKMLFHIYCRHVILQFTDNLSIFVFTTENMRFILYLFVIHNDGYYRVCGKTLQFIFLVHSKLFSFR